MAFTDWLKGYLIISVRGKFPERFLNLCSLEGICLKDTKRHGEELLIKVSKKAFAKMRRPAKKAGCRVKIIKKAGLYFKLKEIGKRKIFVFGAAVFTALVFFLNSFIWAIRIEGNEILTDEEIKFIANYCGLHQGVVKYKVDEKKFSEKALEAEPRLAWIWPEIKGTVCYIRIREKALSDPPTDTRKPCDIIAKKSGIISEITVKRGWAAVSEGDSVVKGQVLISSEKEGFSPVHAEGDVFASRWTEVRGIAETEKETLTYTGREKRYYSVVIGPFGMSFRFSGKAPYECFEVEREERDLMLFGEIPLPVKIKKTEYREALKDKITRSVDVAVNEETERIISEFEKNLPPGVTVREKTVKTVKISENETEVAVIFECSENIALAYTK